MRRIWATCAFALMAACTGPTYDTRIPPQPFDDAVSPAVYVAKVKNLLVGLAPTDAEVDAVIADPTALAGLIDGWMQLPEYHRKMLVFFELAFQQTQINVVDFVDISPSRGIGVGKPLPLLVQNTRESFARTVLDLVAQDRPLTDAFTTHTFMMTPALMQLYAYFDARRVDNAGKSTDDLAKANPTLTYTLTASGPIPVAQSVDPTSANYMHWYNPEVATLTYPDTACNGVDPVTIPVSSGDLFEIMYGVVASHDLAGGAHCGQKSGSGIGMQLLPSDFTTWKPVTIRPPGPGETTTRFFDLPTFRSATELVLNTPRVGFFSTPAFHANWPTNSSNQMRVTVNQALIVATGAQIDGTDGTQAPTTPGLDAVHAEPGSACFGCHQLLDPTRSILSSTYTWFYSKATDQKLITEHGLFAFQHVIADMTTIDDFARVLATHPLTAPAWVQKLCYYVNSAPCDPTDPEFVRIAAKFGEGMSWTGLVRDLLSSPITTNAAASKTHTTNGEVIAVSRRDHLCAQLNNRLGFVDICQLEAANQTTTLGAVAQIVSGMPSDGYGRGGTVPILPNQPTLFYRSGVENICAQVSAMVIDAAVDPKQPNAKHWSSTDPDAAIADFVSIIVGVTASDPRAPQIKSLLAGHFATAKADTTNPVTPTDALRSTFVTACLSPTFIGIGM